MPSTITDRLNGLTTSVAVKAPCRAATTANITLSGEQTIDGIAVVAGDRVLVKNQTSAVNNGIYVAASGAWTRAADFDGSLDGVGGTQIYVIAGTANVNSYWRIDGATTPTIGTSSISFVAAGLSDSASHTFIQSGTGAVARTMQVKARETVSLADFGAVGDGVTNDYAAFLAAHNALPANGGTIIVPTTTANNYYFATTLNVRKKIRLIGMGPAQGTGTQGTKFTFPAGIDGIIFNNSITNGRVVITADPLFPGAGGSYVENIMFLGTGGAGNFDGVVLRTPVKMFQCHARNWPRDGFHVRADIGGGTDLEGDANGWFFENCQSILNGRHGFYASGADSNVGTALKCFVTLNTGYGFYDDSFIGCNWIACDSAGNVAGSIWAANATQSATVIGFWEDDNLDFSELGTGVTSIGGNGGNPSATSTGFHQHVGLARWAPYRYQNSRGSQIVGSQLGALGTVKVAFMFGALTDEASVTAWSFEYDATNKCWRYEYAASSSFRPIALINGGSTAYTLKGLTGPVFQNGYAVKNAGTAEGSALVRLLAAAAPVSGTFQVGDIVYNSAPAASGFIGWVCTTAGSPGVWKTWGAISA